MPLQLFLINYDIAIPGESLRKIWTPLILINFKSYTEGIGQRALKLAKEAETVARRTDVCIGLAPQHTQITELARAVSLPIFAQHVDPIEPGSFTGHVLAEAVKEAGAVGTLINHSEQRLKLASIQTAIRRIRKLKLVSVVCANNADVSASAAALKPDFIAIEPPELIGTGIPVSKAQPEIITETVSRVEQIEPEITVLCGAGISRGEDVAAALELGTKGVLVASGIVKAEKPAETIMEFAEAART